ncbi:hypothetical protein EHQ53_11420 [Leptospira langatensis]|uniref:Lipoprotein n=1 Tax=Leptospira langatensis TaxID=2484983 RepID=A0A5F1ZS35_9LEPT|nr:hypothetical protein [Leptospira langatensis]TGJ98842.1 hypothetical protein EHO57_15080 [Leptospira langatensis]TGL40592.1 hypothetical protein EHQ53_11420 [Leptospira langatensis]
MVSFFQRVLFLLFLVSLSLLNCSGAEKKLDSMDLPVLELNRAEMPILVQFEDDQEYNAKTVMATFFTGVEGKDRRADREYARFPLLVGNGARAKELELEGTVTRKQSYKYGRKEIYLLIEGNKLSHNCGLGIKESSASNLSKQFRSVKIYFSPTGQKDIPASGFSIALGLVTYMIYPLFITGFVVEKMDCGLIVEG